MNFEEHFLTNDIAAAKSAFSKIVTNLKLVNGYIAKKDEENAQRVSKELTNALSDLHELACRKENSKTVYLHYLLNKPQGWHPA